MALHLTPLKRTQLLDLCSLVKSALHSSCATPTSGLSSSGILSSSNCNNNPAAVTTTRDFCADEHPFATGAFCDVFEDPLTRHAWRLYDKMLYLVWWSYRPTSCTECGMQDAWVPSADSEMKCGHCGTGAGTTSMNDIVEDIQTMDDANGDYDDGGSDGENVGGDVVEGGEPFASNTGGGGPVALYMFFYEWLLRIGQTRCVKGLVLPVGESLAAVLRAAYDLALLFVLPGLPSGGAAVLRGGALYLSLVLHRFSAPFPLFSLAGRVQSLAAASPTAMARCVDGEQDEELQWVDVELLASLIGVTLSDFFESCQVGVQYLQNVMTVAASFAVPSALWHPQRVQGLTEYMMSLRKNRRCSSSHQYPGFSTGLSPEHTAMIVALELARAFDSQPCAPEYARRIGAWLDQLGLYPQRTSYTNSSTSSNNKTTTTTADSDGGAARTTTTTAAAAVEDVTWWTSPLTTDTSPFAGMMHVVLPSPSANALLHVFANVFSMSVLELADMVASSGIYCGPTRFFETLRQAAQEGNYTLMPLSRRLSPITSLWTSTYFAVHSEDRLPLLAALQHMRTVTTREKEIPVARVVQRILRKHHSVRRYQLNYSIRVSDDSERQQLKGVYFLSYVNERCAVFTGVRSARKTITFDGMTGDVIFCVAGARGQRIETGAGTGANGLDVEFNGPVVVHVESAAAKCAIDCVRQGLGATAWQTAVRLLDRCGRVRRRMRVPMLASRLEALASLRATETTASHGGVSIPSYMRGGHTMETASGQSHALTTLLGWGETEVLLTALPHVHTPAHVRVLRCQLQRNLLSFPTPSLVFGVSENRVIAMYAVLVALLERIEQELTQLHASTQGEGGKRTTTTSGGHNYSTSGNTPPMLLPMTSTASSLTWIDVLLYEDDMETCAGMTPLPTGSPRLKATPSPHVGHSNSLCESPVQLPASTAMVGLEQLPLSVTRQTSAPQQQQRGQEMDVVPSYQDILLGLADASSIIGGGSRARGIPMGRTRSVTQQRERQQRRGGHIRSRAEAGDGAGRPLAKPHISTLSSCYTFNLFSAEECRRRLYRLLQFITSYKAEQLKRERASAVGVGETGVMSSTVDTPPVGKKDTPSREKGSSPKHHTAPLRSGGTPSMHPQPAPTGMPSSLGVKVNNNTNNSPALEAMPQHQLRPHRHHNRRRRRSRSTAIPDSSEDSEDRGRSPVIAGEGTPRSRKRLRHQNNGGGGGERRSIININKNSTNVVNGHQNSNSDYDGDNGDNEKERDIKRNKREHLE